MLIELTSKSNKIYKHIKSLGIRSHREKNNEFIIEGIKIIKDAVDAAVDFKIAAVSDSFLQDKKNEDMINWFLSRQIDVYKFTDQMFKEISHTETPQGILGVVSIKQYMLDHLSDNKNAPFYVFCDGVQDPGNMGTIIRTADAAGADAVILSKGCVDIYNPKTVRSTMGSMFHVPIIKAEDTIRMIRQLKKNGISIISGHLSASTYHFDINMRKGIVIVIGNEGNGISNEVVELSDHLVKIPITGNAESLNAAVAAAILMYEIVRQRIN